MDDKLQEGRPWRQRLLQLHQGGAPSKWRRFRGNPEWFQVLRDGRDSGNHLDSSTLLSRTTTGKWIRLNVRGPIPTKVAINQIVYWARPLLFPMLRCPGCLKIGHSINTCRSPGCCSRCSGSHSFHLDGNTCTRLYHCFQCGGSHGPKPAHCPYNQDVQQLYNTLARDGVTLHQINKQLQAPCRPSPPPPPKPTSTSTSSSAKTVQPGVSFASITTENRYITLITLQEEEDSIQEDTPIAATSPPTRRFNHPRKPPRRQSDYLPPPTIPIQYHIHNTFHVEIWKRT